MTKIVEGMQAAKVRELLGEPDDVQTESDPGGIPRYNARRVWRYGTAGHLRPATLGEVSFNEENRVLDFVGQGKAIGARVLKEEEVRQILDALGQGTSYFENCREYNPRIVIKAVNLLQPLGKKKALAVVDEFLRVTTSWNTRRDVVFLVLRILFEVPKDTGHMPRLYASSPIEQELIPRFPIALHGDIPFLVGGGAPLAGGRETPEMDVDYFRKHGGQWRQQPLMPTDQPYVAMQSLMQDLFQEKANDAENFFYRDLFREQLLRLVSSVYYVEPNQYGQLLPTECGAGETPEAHKMMDDISKLKIHWDHWQSKYVYTDGTSLPEPKPNPYRRHVWRPRFPGQKSTLIIERTTPKYVSIWLEQTCEENQPHASAVLKLFGSDKTKVLAEYKVFVYEGELPNCGRGEGCDLEIPDGGEITAVFSLPGKPPISETFKP